MPDLTCPVCGGVLHREERSLRCGAGHCYDIARQGYVNLLRSNQSKSKRIHSLWHQEWASTPILPTPLFSATDIAGRQP